MATAGELRARVRQALAEQRRVVARLLRQRAQLQGSLLVRHMECGKPGCACHTGRKHGPYFVLSNRSGGRGAYAYLDAPRASRARALVRRYRAFRPGPPRPARGHVAHGVRPRRDELRPARDRAPGPRGARPRAPRRDRVPRARPRTRLALTRAAPAPDAEKTRAAPGKSC